MSFVMVTPRDLNPNANAEVVTGTYVGDGSPAQLIVTGLSGPLRSLNIFCAGPVGLFFVENEFYQNNLMPGDLNWQAQIGTLAAEITFIGPDFTVAKTPDPNFPYSPNEVGVVYHWTATAV